MLPGRAHFAPPFQATDRGRLPNVGREARRLRPGGRSAPGLRLQRGRTEAQPFAQHLESATPEGVLERCWRCAGLRRTFGVIMYTKSQLLQAKAQSGAPREGFRTAKNLILVLLVAIKPDVEGTFKSDMGKTGEMLTEISGISMNTRKNALGYYGTPRWNENVKFIGSLLTRSSSRSNLSPSKARESESSSLKSASKRA